VNWRPSTPAAHRALARSAIERIVQLNRIELRGLEAEIIRRLQIGWVKTPLPACRRERRSAKTNDWLSHHARILADRAQPRRPCA
jgi:hypothetical protein